MTKPGIYRHYKGALYRVLFTALESTNGRARVPVVVYVSLERGSINVREEHEFHEPVKRPDLGVDAPRFVYVGDGVWETLKAEPHPTPAPGAGEQEEGT